MKNEFIKINTSQFLAILIFSIALLLRWSAIQKIFPNNNEAQFLLSLTNNGSQPPMSFLYSILIKPILFFTGNNYVGARMPNMIAGLLLVLLPFLFEKSLGKKTVLFLSLFFAIDPFLIANSTLSISHNFILLFSGLLWSSIFSQKKRLSAIFFILMILSGYGISYFLVLTAIILFFDIWNRKINKLEINVRIKNFLEIFKSNISTKILIILLVLILSFVLGITVSSIINDPLLFFSGWATQHQKGNTPLLYPTVLFAYIPLAIFMTGLYIIFWRNQDSARYLLLLIWMLGAVLVVSFYPNHRFIDLVWVSIPGWVITSIVLSNFDMTNLLRVKNNVLAISSIMVIFFSLILTIIGIINKIGYQSFVFEEIILIIVLLTVTLIILIFYAYLTSIRTAAHILIFSVLFLAMIFQISAAMRTSGINKTPESELLWNGYLKDSDLVKKIVNNERTFLLGTKGNLNTVSLVQNNYSTLWLFKQMDISINDETGESNPRWHMVITEFDNLSETDYLYYGQKFIVNSYPGWINQSRFALVTNDFWKWLFFRQSNLYEEINFLWVKVNV